MASRLDNQRGGAYAYQWQLASLILCETFLSPDLEQRHGLPSFVYDFLQRVTEVTLEARKNSTSKHEEEEEDLNLYGVNGAVFVQIKARGENQKAFKRSEFAKFLGHFAKTAAAQGDPSNHLYVLVSDGTVADNLLTLIEDPKNRNLDSKLIKGLLDFLDKQKSKEGGSSLDQSFLRQVILRTVFFQAPRLGIIQPYLNALLARSPVVGIDAQQLVAKVQSVSVLADDELRRVTSELFSLWIAQSERPGQLWHVFQRDPELLQEVGQLIDDLGPRTFAPNRLNLGTFLRHLDGFVKGLDRLTVGEAGALVAAAAIPHWESHLKSSFSSQETLLGHFSRFPRLWSLLEPYRDEVLALKSYRADQLTGSPNRPASCALRMDLLAALLQIGALLEYHEGQTCESTSAPLPGSVVEYWQYRYLKKLTFPNLSSEAVLEFRFPEQTRDQYKSWLAEPFLRRLESAASDFRQLLRGETMSLCSLSYEALSSPSAEVMDDCSHAAIEKEYSLRRALELQREKIDQRLILAQASRDKLTSFKQRLLQDTDLPLEQGLQLLSQLRELGCFAQARQLCEMFVKRATELEHPRSADRFRLEALSAILDGGFAPEFARAHVEALEASSLLDPDRQLWAEILKGRYYLGGELSRKRAEEVYEKALQTKSNGTGAAPRTLATLAVHWAFLYVLSQQWDEADAVFLRVYPLVKDHLESALAVLTARVNLATLSGDTTAAASVNEDWLHLRFGFPEASQGPISWRYRLARADFSCRVGDLESALAAYESLEKELVDSEPALLSLLLNNSLYMTTVSGPILYGDHDRRESQSIDLYYALESGRELARRTNTAYRSHSAGDQRKSLQNALLAMETAWCAGDWTPFENIWRLLSRLYLEDGRYESAVRASLQSQDRKVFKSAVSAARENLPPSDLQPLVELALEPSSLPQIEAYRFQILTQFTDLIPAERFRLALDKVRAVLKQSIQFRVEVETHTKAAEALKSLVRDTEPKDQEVVFEVLFEALHHPWWQVKEQALRALHLALSYVHWSISKAQRQKAVSRLLEMAAQEDKLSHLVGQAYEVAVSLTEQASQKERTFLLRELKRRNSLTPEFEIRLRQTLPKDVVDQAIQEVLARLAPAPQQVGGFVRYPSTFVSASELIPFLPHVKDMAGFACKLQRTYESEQCYLSSRTSITFFLAQLSRDQFSLMIPELIAGLVRALEKGLAMHPVARFEKKSRASKFSGVRIQSTDEVEAHQGLLTVLGRALAHTNPADKLEELLFREAFSQDDTARKGVAAGLMLATQDGYFLGPKMLKVMLYLLGSTDKIVQNQAISALGWALKHHRLPEEETLIPFVLRVSHSLSPITRTGAAWAMKRALEGDAKSAERILFRSRLKELSKDPSRQVRVAATRGTPRRRKAKADCGT